MYKKLLLSLLFIVNTYGFVNVLQMNNMKISKPTMKLSRRSSIKVLPIICSPILLTFAANAEDKSIEELREEANRIIEIIDAQKEAFNLPSLKDNVQNVTNKNVNSKSNENYIIKNKLEEVLNNFKNKDALTSIKYLQSKCANSNPLKVQKPDNLIETFNNSKYAILLGKFDKYDILNYEKIFDSDVNSTYWNVDVKVEANYKTMIYNSIQFDDMYYSKQDDNMCYVIYRWIFKELDDDYLIDGCYLVPK